MVRQRERMGKNMSKELAVIKSEEVNYDFKIENGEVFVSSLYVAKITDKKHKNVMRDIRTILDKSDKDFNELNFEPSDFKDKKGENRPMYWLTEDGSSVLLGGYSIAHRVKIQKELRDFKDAQKKKIPQTYGEALLEAGRLAIENEKLILENSIMKPKADYFDALVDRKLLTNFRDTAKELGIKEREFITFLIDNEYIYKDSSKRNRPYAKYTGTLFQIKEFKNTTIAGLQTLVTPQGKETFRLLLQK
jgi:Rha family phage regulatory protein